MLEWSDYMPRNLEYTTQKHSGAPKDLYGSMNGSTVLIKDTESTVSWDTARGYFFQHMRQHLETASCEVKITASQAVHFNSLV